MPVCANPVQNFKCLKYLEYSNYFKYFNIQTCPCVRILSPKFTASPSRSSSTSFAGSRQILVRWEHNDDDEEEGDGDDNDAQVHWRRFPGPDKSREAKTSLKFHMYPQSLLLYHISVKCETLVENWEFWKLVETFPSRRHFLREHFPIRDVNRVRLQTVSDNRLCSPVAPKLNQIF